MLSALRRAFLLSSLLFFQAPLVAQQSDSPKQTEKQGRPNIVLMVIP